MKKIAIRIIQIVCFLAISLLLIVQLFQRLAPDSNGFFGFRTFIIVSSSMEPKLKVGDVILVKNRDPKKIKVGDVISYEGESENYKNKIITHQVKSIQLENKRHIFYTKGSSNSGIDPAVYEEQVYGVMIYKFFALSLVSKIIRNMVGFVIFVVLPLILLFISEIKSVAKDIEERR